MTTVDPIEVTVADPVPEIDRFDVRRARHAPGLLRAFNDAGVLAAADIHVALRLGAIAAADDENVLLATALAVRAPRLGHVCIDLATIRHTATVDADVPVDLQTLPWPDAANWVDRLAASSLVAVGVGATEDRPLRLVGTLLYLDRYWREERQVAAELAARGADPAAGVDLTVLAEGLERLFDRSESPDADGGDGRGRPRQNSARAEAANRADGPDLQRLAAATAVLRRLSVVAGGPGTGKTTTVARILALLGEQAVAAGLPPPLVALAAPTGKAAARLEEAVHGEARQMDVTDATRERLLATNASTLHRLLGTLPRNRARFRHDRGNRLPHDVVVIDETSMVPLSLMARLLEAVRAGARLVLVGDPEQLASVEAGAVLGDIVGPAADGLLMRPPARRLLADVSGQDALASDPPAGVAIGDGVVVLRHVHRYDGDIGDLAEAVRAGDDDAALAVLSKGDDNVTWIPIDVADPGTGPDLAPVHAAAVAAGRRVVEAARTGDARTAIGALGDFRLLCAHRRGPYGVATWMNKVESWLAAAIDSYATEGAWYAGRPLLVTENDYALRLYNGDTGVVVATAPGRLAAVFERRGELLEFSPTRLGAVDTVHAMTIHKSQGSQFDTVAVLLPGPDSPILTRELFYTAATRARQHLILVGTEPTVRAAVTRPIARASGLRRRLWGQ